MRKKSVSFEIKSLTEKGEFTGYGAFFGNPDDYGDVIVKGAFEKTLKEHDEKNTFPYMFFDHHFSEIGEYIDIKEDEKGLFVHGKLWIDGNHPDVNAMKAYRGMTKNRGNMGLSIGWLPYEGGEKFDRETGMNYLTNIKLFEISPVYFPANENAGIIDVKSSEINTIREFERFLRDSGFSKKRAVEIASCGWSQRDSDDIDNAKKLIERMKKCLS